MVSPDAISTTEEPLEDGMTRFQANLRLSASGTIYLRDRPDVPMVVDACKRKMRLQVWNHLYGEMIEALPDVEAALLKMHPGDEWRARALSKVQDLRRKLDFDRPPDQP